MESRFAWMHRYLNACAENVSEKTLRLARGNLRGSKANHLDRGLQVAIGKPKLFITFEEGHRLKLRRDHRQVDITPGMCPARRIGAEQDYPLDGDPPGFEGGDVASGEGCNLASCLNHSRNFLAPAVELFV